MNSQICYVLLFDIVKGSRVKKESWIVSGKIGERV